MPLVALVFLRFRRYDSVHDETANGTDRWSHTTSVAPLLSSSDDTNSSRLQSLLVVRIISLAYESSSSFTPPPPPPPPPLDSFTTAAAVDSVDEVMRTLRRVLIFSSVDAAAAAGDVAVAFPTDAGALLFAVGFTAPLLADAEAELAVLAVVGADVVADALVVAVPAALAGRSVVDGDGDCVPAAPPAPLPALLA
uniref:Uncharacterized protein n=1 Tax=Anopheles farauti TaxID=69004 RepID=A0A182QGZ5_9DIPT